MILNFEDFALDESNKEVTPALRKSLDILGIGFEDDKEIIKAIEFLGFEEKHLKRITAEHIFYYPEKNLYYLTFSTGYVRSNRMGIGWLGHENINKTPITKAKLKTSRDRLLLVLRRVLKTKDLYSAWKKSGIPVKEFIHNKRGALLGKKYGI